MTRRLALLAAATALGALLLVALPAGAIGNPPHDQPVNIGPSSFPDPFVLKVGEDWYAYGTDGDLGDVQVIKSTGDNALVDWTNVGTAIEKSDQPTWAQTDDVWAPAVLKAGSNYVLYSTYLNKNTGFRCIGAATSTNPGSGFKAAGPPLLCNDTEGGVIDPDVFVGFGGSYLLWKTEGVPGAIAPALWSQQLADNGLSLEGSPSRLLSSRYPYEGALIENPTMVLDAGRLYLFYSGNEWESGSYAVGWGVCETIQGPCAAPPDKPLLATEGTGIVGPGGGTVFTDGTGQWWLGFAAWTDPSKTTEETGTRKLFFRRLQFQGGRPVLQAGDGTYPAPAVAQRVAGTDRYETSARFASRTVQAFRPVTYIATGADFPDALASGPASGFERSPVLLVQRDSIPPGVDAELRRIRPGHIVVMGGTNAISDAVYNKLRGYAIGGDPIHRESGVNRYHTAALVSRNTYDPGVGVAYVATGERYADALAGGAAGARNKAPLLLVQQNGIPFDTGEELARVKPQRIVVLGGPSAVSHEVLVQLAQYSGNVTRVAGNDRYETAALLARQEFGSLIGGLVIATGANFADAVAAGAAGFPVLLVPSTGAAPASVKAALDALAPLGVLVMGGPNAVSDTTLASLGL